MGDQCIDLKLCKCANADLLLTGIDAALERGCLHRYPINKLFINDNKFFRELKAEFQSRCIRALMTCYSKASSKEKKAGLTK